MYKKPVQADDTFWLLEVNINPGKLDDFIAVAHDLFRTMDGEAGTLGYGDYLNDDKTVCHIHEHYRDSEGLKSHADNFGKVFAMRFMAACTPTKLHSLRNTERCSESSDGAVRRDLLHKDSSLQRSRKVSVSISL